jgi:ABC-type antimicrobial peptide transport system ATPase subunit
MKQRTVIAVSVILFPKVLIADDDDVLRHILQSHPYQMGI